MVHSQAHNCSLLESVTYNFLFHSWVNCFSKVHYGVWNFMIIMDVVSTLCQRGCVMHDWLVGDELSSCPVNSKEGPSWIFPVLGTEGSQEACHNLVGNSLIPAALSRCYSPQLVSLVFLRAVRSNRRGEKKVNKKKKSQSIWIKQIFEIPSVLNKIELNSQAQCTAGCEWGEWVCVLSAGNPPLGPVCPSPSNNQPTK